MVGFVLRVCLLCLVLFGVPATVARADGAVELRDRPVAASGHMATLIDRAGRLGIAEVATAARQGRFEPVPGAVRAGYTDATVWVRLVVRNAGVPVWWLAVEPPFLDSITVFAPDEHGGWTAQHGGDTEPMAAMPVPHRLAVFPLTLPAGRDVEIFLRIASTSALNADAVFYPPPLFPHRAVAEALFGGGFLAIYAVIILNIVYRTHLRGGLYASYCGWMVANGIAFFAVFGYAHEFVLTGGSMAPSRLLEISAVAALPVGTLFIIQLLYLRRNRPWFARIYRVAFWIGVACLAATLAGLYRHVVIVVNGLGMVLGLLAIGLSVDLALRGFRPARLYALAFAAHPFGLAIATLRNTGLLAPGLLVDNSYAVASLLNALALAVGLLDRINMDERAKQEAKQAALDSALKQGRELESRIAVTEQALHRTEALFETLATSAPVPLLVASAERRTMLFANDSAARLLGLPVAEILTRTTLDTLLPPGDLARLFAALEERGIVVDLEVAVLGGEAGPRWTVLSAARVHFSNQPGVLIGINDITARRHLEAELMEARNQAEAALALERLRMQEQRQLISTTAHEFKTPLAVIDRAAQLLQFDLDGGRVETAEERATARLRTMRDSVRRLRSVVDSFLADAALEAGQLPATLRPTVLAPLVERSVAMLDARLPPRSALCRLDDGLTCQADGRLLSIVLDNLLDNACKYSSPGTAIEIVGRAVGCDEGGHEGGREGEIELTVADRGIGVPAVELDRVGSRFFRASNATGIAGTGLGLSTARHLMALQNGTITLEPRPGGGTVARIRLGRALDTERAGKEPPPAEG